ncbi:MAG: cell division protein FtsL [Rhodobacteraceae bacterium]|uniref:cell division protein FtsL n=1 Tax=Amaricoccus sp. B4 TaxID=3368557 RepID=UPI000DACA4AD|nr:cell division protein FtsL [Paracoccaceae bacterium]
MKVVFHLSAIVFVAVCATWAYRVNYAAQEALGRVAALQVKIAREQEALGVLHAEWAYLNRPDRLTTLVAAYSDELGLVPLTPEQFGEAAMVAYPPQPDALQDAAAGGKNR